jgi:hypothetical protein
MLGPVLGTLHNLRHYQRPDAEMREAIAAVNLLAAFRESFLRRPGANEPSLRSESRGRGRGINPAVIFRDPKLQDESARLLIAPAYAQAAAQRKALVAWAC